MNYRLRRLMKKLLEFPMNLIDVARILLLFCSIFLIFIILYSPLILLLIIVGHFIIKWW